MSRSAFYLHPATVAARLSHGCRAPRDRQARPCYALGDLAEAREAEVAVMLKKPDDRTLLGRLLFKALPN